MKNSDYIAILLQSLHKKVEILDKIIRLNSLQKELLQRDIFDADGFEKSITEKGQCIEELNFLDTGFTEVYERVKEELACYKDRYLRQIEEMKKLIQLITDKTVSIRVEEERTKALAARKFAKLRQDIRQRRVSNKAVNEYYKKMSNVNLVDSHFLDKKK